MSEEDAGLLLGVVGDDADRAVGDHVHGVVEGPDDRAPEVDVLDASGLAGNFHPVADAVLLFEDDEDAGKHIAHQALGAEADGDAHHAGSGDHGRHVDTEPAENHEQGGKVDQDLERPDDHGGQRGLPLLDLLGQSVGAGAVLDDAQDDLRHGPLGRLHQDNGNADDDGYLDYLFGQERPDSGAEVEELGIDLGGVRAEAVGDGDAGAEQHPGDDEGGARDRGGRSVEDG